MTRHIFTFIKSQLWNFKNSIAGLDYLYKNIVQMNIFFKRKSYKTHYLTSKSLKFLTWLITISIIVNQVRNGETMIVKMKKWCIGTKIRYKNTTSSHSLMTGRSISSPTSSSSLNPSMSGICTSLITRSNLSLCSLKSANAVIAWFVVVTATPSITKINIILKE